MRSFLILHGIANHRPPEHWQHQLATALRADGHAVRYPALPDADTPDPDAWAAALRAELAAAAGAGARPDGRPGVTVVAHSLACLLWLALAAELPPVARVALVAPPAPEQVPSAGRGFCRGFDPAGVRARVGADLRVVASDDDPYNPVGAGALYAEPLGCPLDVVPGAGHITPADGYGPWPAMLAWCRGEAAQAG